MWEKMSESLKVMGESIVSFYQGLPAVIYVLLAVMILDLIANVVCVLMEKSRKSQEVRFCVQTVYVALFKKLLILAVVILAALIDYTVNMGGEIEFTKVCGITCMWFIATEGLSILDKAAKHVPIPKILLEVLELFKHKGESSQPKDRNEDKDKVYKYSSGGGALVKGGVNPFHGTG